MGYTNERGIYPRFKFKILTFASRGMSWLIT
jgi:hypothetical protein